MTSYDCYHYYDHGHHHPYSHPLLSYHNPQTLLTSRNSGAIYCDGRVAYQAGKVVVPVGALIEQVVGMGPRSSKSLLRAYYVSAEGRGECCAVLNSDRWITGLVYGFNGPRETDNAGKSFLLVVAKAVTCGCNCIQQLLKRMEGDYGGPEQGVIRLMAKVLPQLERHDKRRLLHDLSKVECSDGMCTSSR